MPSDSELSSSSNSNTHFNFVQLRQVVSGPYRLEINVRSFKNSSERQPSGAVEQHPAVPGEAKTSADCGDGLRIRIRRLESCARKWRAVILRDRRNQDSGS